MLTQYTVCSAAVITSLYTIIYFTLEIQPNRTKSVVAEDAKF